VIDVAAQENPVEKSGRFDPQFCQRVFWVGAIICLALTLCAGILFVTFNPSKCPGWTYPRYPGRDETPVPIWPAIAITGLWTLVVSYHAITWKRFARRVLDEMKWGERTFGAETQSNGFFHLTQLRAMSAALHASHNHIGCSGGASSSCARN
jgi:hypothetical protein